MLYDYLLLDHKSKEPLYAQLYGKIKAAVEKGHLAAGEKLPSIRHLSESLRVSRTTVETAYQQLCVEGYIQSSPQRGYFVQEAVHTSGHKPGVIPQITDEPGPKVRYNFGSDWVDSAHTDSKLWKKHVRQVLNRQEAIASYGEHQGETALREALAAYSHSARGVAASPGQIVIGAGTQPLLYLLCGLLKPEERRAAMEAPGFQQAEQVFADCSIPVRFLPQDQDGVTIRELEASMAKVLLVSPSNRLQIIPMARRVQLLQWAERTGGILVEDDYNGELRYRARPVPAMQGMASERVVYLGSFSKLLLPSVRIGYMVLPEPLLKRYRKRAARYNQTASKIEQLALADYIREGRLEKQLRRLRKLYAVKSTRLTETLRQMFGPLIDLSPQETSLRLLVTVKNGMDSRELVQRARTYGVRLQEARNREGCVVLGFAGIPVEEMAPAVARLKEAWLV